MGTLHGLAVYHGPDQAKRPTSAPDSEYVGVTELARRLSVTPKTIYNHVASGKLGRAQGYRTFGGRVLFHWPSVAAAIERGDL